MSGVPLQPLPPPPLEEISALLPDFMRQAITSLRQNRRDITTVERILLIVNNNVAIITISIII